MEMIYNSPHFCVFEFAEVGTGDQPASGGYEIMSKTLQREIFLRGTDAEQFKTNVQALIAKQPSEEEVDEFLSGYSALMGTRLTLH
jgi:hypothetical protein